MTQHFRAFSFVDRIHAIQPGARIRGRYAIPPGLAAFPLSLVAEAVGQLAAWAAMAAVDFQSRPVAGLAASIDLLAPVRPGQVLDLAADLASVDLESAAYEGGADVDGRPVLRLQGCVGPMLPVEQFDDPMALRERFALLQGPGAAPGAFGGLPDLPLEFAADSGPISTQATLRVPEAAPLFSDHFPRRPVFPGSLLMHANLEVASALAARLPAPVAGGSWAVRGVRDMKLRAFTPPGAVLEIVARPGRAADDEATLVVETRSGSRMVGGARVDLKAEGRS